MPYLESGRGLKRIKKRRTLYRRLEFKLRETERYLRELAETQRGESKYFHPRYWRELQSHFLFDSPISHGETVDNIDTALMRFKGMLIEGAYGWVYGYELLPAREGGFYYSAIIDLDKFFLQINSYLDPRDKEEFEMIRYDDKIKTLLNDYGVISSFRGAYFNYALDLWKIKQDYDKSEWASKIADLKEEGREGALEQTNYFGLDIIILSRIEAIVVPEIF